MDSSERRRHLRLPKEVRMTCQEITYPLGASTELELATVDVSEGGVRFEAPSAPVLGAVVQVALVLQGWHRHTSGFLKYEETAVSKPLTAIGRVVRCFPTPDGAYEVGVEFVDIWDDHWRAVRRYLEGEAERLEAAGRD